MTKANCLKCKHRKLSREGNAVLIECGHDVCRGNMCCGACGCWRPMGDWKLFRRKLRCSECKALQDMPAMNDWRIGVVGYQDAETQTPPGWCPGFESSEPEPPKEKPQLSLF